MTGPIFTEMLQNDFLRFEVNPSEYLLHGRTVSFLAKGFEIALFKRKLWVREDKKRSNKDAAAYFHATYPVITCSIEFHRKKLSNLKKITSIRSTVPKLFNFCVSILSQNSQGKKRPKITYKITVL